MSNFCPYPFNHIHLGTDGKYKPCCEVREKIHYISSLSPIEWFESDYMERLRQSFREGKKDKLCEQCWKQEDLNLLSLRQMKEVEFDEYRPPEEKFDTNIVSAELQISNNCNLGCLMCGPHSSSYILKENNKLGINSQQFNQKDYTWNDENDSKIIELLNLPSLKYVTLRGGEPFFDNKIFEFISAISDKKKSEIRLELVTNASKFNQKWHDLLIKFKNLRFMFSIDGVSNVYEYIRYPGNWNEVQENVKTIISMPNVSGSIINTVVQNLNILNLEPIIDFSLENDIYLFLSKLHTPNVLDLTNLTDEYKILALQRLEQIQHKKDLAENVSSEINSYISLLRKSHFDETLWNNFLSYIQLKDNYRKKNVFNILN